MRFLVWPTQYFLWNLDAILVCHKILFAKMFFNLLEERNRKKCVGRSLHQPRKQNLIQNHFFSNFARRNKIQCEFWCNFHGFGQIIIDIFLTRKCLFIKFFFNVTNEDCHLRTPRLLMCHRWKPKTNFLNFGSKTSIFNEIRLDNMTCDAIQSVLETFLRFFSSTALSILKPW